jgi:hypothetical protein
LVVSIKSGKNVLFSCIRRDRGRFLNGTIFQTLKLRKF